MYGDMDVDERLKYLDEEYLSDFDAADVDIHADIPLQKDLTSLYMKLSHTL